MATIVGIDARTAPCTGGIYILIDGHRNENHNLGYYDIGSVPESFHIGDVFPIRVTIDWHKSNTCSGNYVDITRIKVVR